MCEVVRLEVCEVRLEVQREDLLEFKGNGFLLVNLFNSYRLLSSSFVIHRR